MRMSDAVAAKAAMQAKDVQGQAREWYAVRSATRQEAALEDGLKRLDLETYQPKRTFWRRLRSKKVRDYRALFPGYVFVLCTPADFDAIHDVEGFHQFVRVTTSEGLLRPMAWPDVAIGDLMMRQAFGDFDDTKSKPAKPEAYRPSVGDAVLIKAGTWFDYVAEVLSLNPSQRQAKVKIKGHSFPPTTVSYKNLDAA